VTEAGSVRTETASDVRLKVSVSLAELRGELHRLRLAAGQPSLRLIALDPQSDRFFAPFWLAVVRYGLITREPPIRHSDAYERFDLSARS
jgi:hypothetical protein